MGSGTLGAEAFHSLADEYMDEDELASELKVKPITVQRWRAAHQGPPFVQIGRKFFYRRQRFMAWVAARERSFDEPKPARRRAARG
jgi:hypothetical protein